MFAEVLHMPIEKLIEENCKLIRRRLAEMNVMAAEIEAMLEAYAVSVRKRAQEREQEKHPDQG